MAEPCDTPRLSRALRRLLRTHALRVRAVATAESAYHDVVLTESLRHGGKMKRASSRRVDVAFEALVDAVIDLQTSQAEVLLAACDSGIPAEAIAAGDEAFRSADRTYAGFLAARTYGQVREAAAHRSLRLTEASL